MQPDYDDFDDIDDNGFNWMLVMVLLLAVAGFFSLAWYAYQTGANQASDGEVVVIKADSSPTREVPKERGGREFPHQEKTIYEAVNPNGGTPVEIELKPEPETPNLTQSADQKVNEIIQRAVQEAQNTSAHAPSVQTPPTPKPAAPAPQPVAQLDEKSKDNPFLPPKVEADVKPAPAPKPQEKVKSQPAPKPPAAPATSGERIQLGAFRSNAEAAQQWKKISRAFDAQLKGKPHQVIRADLGSKGVFYRLRVAGFNTTDDAKATCKVLNSRGQGCFLVK